MAEDLTYYLEALSKLRTDPSHSWPEATLGRAPYKPLLLMSVIDLFAEGALKQNRIQLNPELFDVFHGYWECVMPADASPNIAMPFYYMKSEGFWHLLPKADGTNLNISKPSIAQLNKKTHGALLSESFFELLHDAGARDALRALLIDTYFADSVKAKLREQARVHIAAFQYSRELIQQALGERTTVAPVTDGPVREQGFRKAVVTAYAFSCAFCGIGIRTPDHHTVVEAAHIVPWSVSQNDDPRNGMALCRLCHWTFDKGLLGLGDNYAILFSEYLHTDYNRLGHVGLLEGRTISGPSEPVLWPDKDALSWHRRKIFLRA